MIHLCYLFIEGGSPSFADMSDSLNETLKKCASFKSLEEQIGYQHCSELLASFCWLNIKVLKISIALMSRSPVVLLVCGISSVILLRMIDRNYLSGNFALLKKTRIHSSN